MGSTELCQALKQLELAPVAEDEVQLIRSAKISAVKEQKEQGFVNAGSLGSSAVCTSPDVLNSTLLVQLAADKFYIRNKDTDKLYEIQVSLACKT